MSRDLSKFSLSELSAEVARRKASEELKRKEGFKKTISWNPNGRWKVTTEGDCEGRSVRDLGVFEGHIVDIAFTLGKEAFYQLQFTPVPPDKYVVAPDPEVDAVNISLHIDSGSWDLKGEERVAAFREMLTKRPAEVAYDVEDCNYYSAVKLKRMK